MLLFFCFFFFFFFKQKTAYEIYQCDWSSDVCSSDLEQFSEEAKLLGQLRDYLWQQVFLVSKLVKGKDSEGGKFRDYFDYHEAIKNIPSHRALALFRGRSEGILRLSLKIENEDELKTHPCEITIARDRKSVV